MEEVNRIENDPLENIIQKSLAYVRFAKENSAHFEVMFQFKLQQFSLYPSLFETAAGWCAGLPGRSGGFAAGQPHRRWAGNLAWSVSVHRIMSG